MLKKELEDRIVNLEKQTNELIKVLVALKNGTLKIENVDIKVGDVNNR